MWGLAKTYKHHAKRLLVTGEGITDADKLDAGGNEVCNFFIDAAGPDRHTLEAAKNIWGLYLYFHARYK
ncbi:hypothetical protein PAXRUDRAFT_831873 [Paxillus rubicundulus Ve08.2h10]|uniref:Unplaced genomic scaffold scaffold_727, whole genome shotgun sequence n=1 Tax=Paxillus rubicundulus Ve08.2h10 TaxID=930991 RepID=A0A0D0CUC7_9AGAM|nr:hypothetical protein PAXRUDRAFT_831873 [Paxillus rubicundulus Ve08.2h10]